MSSFGRKVIYTEKFLETTPWEHNSKKEISQVLGVTGLKFWVEFLFEDVSFLYGE